MSRVGKPGYKETAVGWIPVEWHLSKLDELVEKVGSGVTPKGGSESYLSSGVPLIRSQNIQWGRLNLQDVAFISEAQHERMSNSSLKPRDVLLNITGASIGRCAVLPNDFKEGNVNQHVCIIRPIESLEPHYLSHFLLSEFGQGQIEKLQAGGNREGLNYQQIRGFFIALPSIPEQQKIAAILTAVDDKLDLIARQISATQALKQGLMQTLFTRGAGTPDAQGRWHPHTEFQDTELGRIPVGWRVGHLQDYIAALRSGVSVNAEDRIHGDGEVGVLKVSCVLHGKFYPQGHKTVPPEEVARVAEPVLQGRIIISRANTPALVGESAYVDRAWPDLFLPDKLWQTEASDLPHSVKWLAFYLQSPFVRQEISKAATGTSGSMKNIAKPALLNIAMPLVPVAEQEYVAELLSSVVDKLTTLTTQRTHYQSLKRGLMQKLLTGQWRVRVDAATLAPVNEDAPA